MQPDFFQPEEIEFTLPEGQEGPRLWVRRVALWQDASTLLRDIPLRPGVNIIWSPDLSTNGKGVTPHGSGKSTFCRLIRYCLGERHFSNEDQRPLMQNKLPDGFVGAEIMIDGECWDDVFDWRSKRSGSGSPAQELSLETKLTVVRLAIGALSAAEVSASAQARTLSNERDRLRQKLGHLDWFQRQKFDELCESLSYPKDRDPSDETVRKELIDRANEALAKVEGTDHKKGRAPSADQQRKRQALQAERNQNVEKRADLKALLRGLPNEIAAARTEQGTEQARLETGVIVRCTICHVSIDEVKADGCGISLERCNLDEVRTRIDRAEQRVADMEQQKSALPGEITKLDAEIARLDREVAAIDEAFARLERRLSDEDKKHLSARELVREATWFDRQLNERSAVSARVDSIENQIDDLRESMRLERERAAAAIGDLETIFQQLVASLMPRGCSGKMRLDGNGLHPEILLDRGVGLSTAAVESFKIVAFDLAAMILSVNGKASMPSFLIHDSPREADLDADIYANLFDFVLSLEEKASPPPFQYIVTTTTAPSQQARAHEAMRLELSSTPSEARLFAMDF